MSEKIQTDVSVREDLKFASFDPTNFNDVVKAAADIPALKLAFKDAVETLEKIQYYQEHLKEVAKAVEKKFQIRKRMFNKVAKLFHRHEADKFEQETKEVLALYYAIFGDKEEKEET